MEKNNKKNQSSAAVLDTYQKTQVLTSSRETLLLMLYSAAIRNTKAAIEAAKQKEVCKRNQFSIKAQEIVGELRSTLNFEAAPQLAANLDRLYSFVSQRLFEGTIDNNTAFLTEALNTLETLYEGWEQAVASLRQHVEPQTSKD